MITLTKFPLKNFLNDHPDQVLEVTKYHVVSRAEVDNNYTSFEEVDNLNKIKQRTYVFKRIKLSTTQSSVFQRLTIAMKT